MEERNQILTTDPQKVSCFDEKREEGTSSITVESSGHFVLSDHEKYCKTKESCLVGKESYAKGALHYENNADNGKNLKLIKKNKSGKRLKPTPKSLMLTQCCRPKTFSIDEHFEEESNPKTKSAYPTFVSHDTFQRLMEEDRKPVCMQNDPRHHEQSEEISSCSGNRKCYEYDLLRIERNHGRPSEQRKNDLFLFTCKSYFQFPSKRI